MQEDSNGESTFEFVDKKTEDLSASLETMPKTDSMSSLSSSSVSLVPSSTSLTSTGSLLTNVPPPSALPSFVTSESSPQRFPATPIVSQTTVVGAQSTTRINPAVPVTVPPLAFHQTQFCPVIPASKGGPPQSLSSPGASPLTPEAGIEATEENGGDGGAGLFGWVKGMAGGVASSNIISRMAEKARNSVDSMITTLDPQMREFLRLIPVHVTERTKQNSGGDVDIVVASDKEVKVSPIREAFQAVFGKATVTGLAAQPTKVADQPVGFEAATKAARERIATVRTAHNLPPQHPVIAVENFIVEVAPDKWFDMGLLLLSDPGQALELSTFTQGTPVPTPIVALAREATPEDYPLKDTGFNTTVGSLMGQNLQVHPSHWHDTLTGVPRREMVLIAARALAGMYKSNNRTLL